MASIATPDRAVSYRCPDLQGRESTTSETHGIQGVHHDLIACSAAYKHLRVKYVFRLGKYVWVILNLNGDGFRFRDSDLNPVTATKTRALH